MRICWRRLGAALLTLGLVSSLVLPAYAADRTPVLTPVSAETPTQTGATDTDRPKQEVTLLDDDSAAALDDVSAAAAEAEDAPAQESEETEKQENQKKQEKQEKPEEPDVVPSRQVFFSQEITGDDAESLTETIEAEEAEDGEEPQEEVGDETLDGPATFDVGGTYNVLDFQTSGRSQRQTIQAALNAAGDVGGGTVRVPAGVYYLDGALTIYSNTHLICEEGATIVRGDDQTCMLISPNKGSYSKGYNSARNITIEGGVWDGNSKRSSSLKSLMVFRHCQGLTFKDLTLTHATHHYLNVSSSADVLVDNVAFLDAVPVSAGKVGTVSPLPTAEALARFECIHVDVEGADGNDGHDGTVPQNVRVTRCLFRNVYSGVGAHNRPAYRGKACYTQNVAVKNCVFEDVAGRCVNAFQFNGITISGNTCTRVASLALIDDSVGTISKNKVTLTRVPGVEAVGVKVLSCPWQEGITLSKNRISGDSDRVLSLYSCSNLAVSKNVLSGGREVSIYLYDCPGGAVKGNSVKKPGETGIYLTGGSRGGVLTGNTVTGTSATEKGILICTDSDRCALSRNTVKKARYGFYITANTGTSLSCNETGSSRKASIYLTGSAKKVKLSYNDLRKDKGFSAASRATWTMTKVRKPSVATGRSYRTVSVKWKKIASASGYQIQYARVKSFRGSRVVNIASKGVVRKTILADKRRVKLFVRVRAYRTVDGVKYYTDWSPVNTGRTK